MRKKKSCKFEADVTVVGGCGHVGLPLAIAFSTRGLNVLIYDINKAAVEQVNSGNMPFLERGADEALKQTIGRNLKAFDDPTVISKAKYIIIVVGTPVDEHLNPDFELFRKYISTNYRYLRTGQTLILRSTVYPGTTEWLHQYLKKKKLSVGVAFCPERIAEGKAMEELFTLPQIISSFNDHTLQEADHLFSHLTEKRIVLEPVQAELAKLFTNSWRYIQFAVANQFFMLACDYGSDFYEIYDAMTLDYPRATGFPRAGFAAGPCLFKDVMQLSAFSNNNFFLGHSAMLINEGLPNFIVQKLKEKYPLKRKIVGILGMAFKADSDDKRSSLSYKLRKILQIESKCVLCSDSYIKDGDFVSAAELIQKSDIIILGAPHSHYKNMDFKNKKVIDVWNYYNRGALI